MHEGITKRSFAFIGTNIMFFWQTVTNLIVMKCTWEGEKEEGGKEGGEKEEEKRRRSSTRRRRRTTKTTTRTTRIRLEEKNDTGPFR